MSIITLELLKHYLKNAVINAKQVEACVYNRASKETLKQEIDRLIGFLEGGYDFIACIESRSNDRKEQQNS